MSDSPIRIRPATLGDAAALAHLLTQLGYPNTADEVHARMSCFRDGADAALVACSGDTVYGLAALHFIPLLQRDGHVLRVTAFVIDKSTRRAGIGSELLNACERHAIACGAERVEITSADSRVEAHEFYVGRGYAREGQRFTKPLVPQPR